jgi:hypothetical protein
MDVLAEAMDVLADWTSSKPLSVKVSAARAELAAIQPAEVVDGPAVDGGLDVLPAGVEDLGDDEIEGLLAAGMEEGGDD